MGPLYLFLQVVRQNPILTAQLSMDKCRKTQQGWPKWFAEPGSHNVDTVLSVEAPGHCMGFKEKASNLELLQFLQDVIAPVIPALGTCKDQLKRGSKLFAVSLVHLDDGYVVYSVSVSHSIADAATYFRPYHVQLILAEELVLVCLLE